jgi:hypothetical protein
MGRTSMESVWQDISSLSAIWETFCGIHDPQFDISNLDIVGIYENIFGTSVMQLIVNKMNMII